MDIQSIIGDVYGSKAPAKSSGFEDIVGRASSEYGVDPGYVNAHIKAESDFNPNAIGPKTKYGTAKGLMQLLDSTAMDLGVEDPFDPEQNITGGTKYLSQLLNRYGGDQKKASAAYNAGPGNVDKAIEQYGDKWLENLHEITGEHAEETRDYLDKISAYYEGGNGKSPLPPGTGMSRSKIGRSDAWNKAFGYSGRKGPDVNSLIQNVYGPPEPPEEEPGMIKSAGRGLAHGTIGLAETTGTALEYLGRRFDSEGMVKAGKTAKEYWHKKAEPFGPHKEIAGKNVWDNPELLADTSWWAYNVADMVPAFAAMMVPAVGVEAAMVKIGSRAVPLTSQAMQRLFNIGRKVAVVGTAGLTGGGIEGLSTYNQVLEKGGSEKEAARAGEFMTIASGILNSIGISKILQKAGAGFKAKLIKTLGSGVWEGITEGLEEPSEVISKVLAKYVEGEPIPDDIQAQLIESLKDALTVAPIAGVTGAGGSVIHDIGTKQTISDPDKRKEITDNIAIQKKKAAKEIRDEMIADEIAKGPEGKSFASVKGKPSVKPKEKTIGDVAELAAEKEAQKKAEAEYEKKYAEGDLLETDESNEIIKRAQKELKKAKKDAVKKNDWSYHNKLKDDIRKARMPNVPKNKEALNRLWNEFAADVKEPAELRTHFKPSEEEIHAGEISKAKTQVPTPGYAPEEGEGVRGEDIQRTEGAGARAGYKEETRREEEPGPEPETIEVAGKRYIKQQGKWYDPAGRKVPYSQIEKRLKKAKAKAEMAGRRVGPERRAEVREGAVERRKKERRSIAKRKAVEQLSPEEKEFVIPELRRMLKTQKKAALRQERIANSDPLTGLKNRRGLEKATVQRENEGKESYHTFIDLIGFKGLNDYVSHEAGDATLKYIAKAMKAVGLENPTRWGGDELMYQAESVEAGESDAQKLHDYFEKNPLRIQDEEGKEYDLTIMFRHGTAKSIEEADANAEAKKEGEPAEWKRGKAHPGLKEVMPTPTTEKTEVALEGEGVEEKPKEKIGVAWVKNQQKPILLAREIKRGKNKGRIAAMLAAGRDEEGLPREGKKIIVDKNDIIEWPEAMGKPKPKPEVKKESEKVQKIRTLRGWINHIGKINPLNFKGEVKNLPLPARYLFKNDGVPIDDAVTQLKEDGWLDKDTTVGSFLEDLRTNPNLLSRDRLTRDISEKKEHEKTKAEKRLEKEMAWEPESPPEGEYETIIVDDLKEGETYTIIENRTRDGWDEYKIHKTKEGVTLEDGTILKLEPWDKVQVLKEKTPRVKAEPGRKKAEKLLAKEKVARKATSEFKQEGIWGPKQRVMFSGKKTAEKSKTTTDQVLDIVTLYAQGMTNFPKVQVVQSIEQLPNRLRTKVTAYSKKSNKQVEGFYDKAEDQVFLIADNLSEGRVEAVLRHEAEGHRGIRLLLGSDLDGFLDQVARSKRKDLERYDPGLNFKDQAAVRVAADEWVARKIEAGNLNKSLWDDLIRVFRKWLRKFVPNLKLTNSEIQSVLTDTVKNAREGWVDRISETQGVLYSDGKRGISKPMTSKKGPGDITTTEISKNPMGGKEKLPRQVVNDKGEFRLRITDGYQHAVEFYASDEKTLIKNMSKAYNELIQKRIDEIPEYQTRKRELAKEYPPPPQLQIPDEKSSIWFRVHDIERGLHPIYTIRSLFADRGKTAWKHILENIIHLAELNLFAKSISEDASILMEQRVQKIAKEKLKLIKSDPLPKPSRPPGEGGQEDPLFSAISESEIKKPLNRFIHKGKLNKKAFFDRTSIDLPSNDPKDLIKGVRWIQTMQDMAKNFPNMRRLFDVEKQRIAESNLASVRDRETTEAYFTLNKESEERVNRALLDGDELGEIYTDKQLAEDYGLNPEEIAGYKAVRKALGEKLDEHVERILSDVVDTTRTPITPEMVQDVKAAKTEDDLKEVLMYHFVSEYEAAKLPWLVNWLKEFKGYVPHKWDADWLVRVDMGKDKEYMFEVPAIGGKAKPTRKGRQKSAKKVAVQVIKERLGLSSDEIRDLAVSGKIVVVRARDLPVDLFEGARMDVIQSIVNDAQDKMWKETVRYMAPEQAKDFTEMQDLLKGHIQEMYLAKGWGRHLMGRRGVKGYRTDLKNVISSYLIGANKFTAKGKAAKEFANVMKDVSPTETPEQWKHGKQYVSDMLGESSEAGWFKKVAGTWFLAGDLSAAVLNMTQNWTHAVPMLRSIKPQKDRITSEKEIFRAMKDIAAEYTATRGKDKKIFSQASKHISQDEIDALQRAYGEGSLDPAFLGETTGYHASKIWDNYAKKIWGILFKLFTGAEGWNRTSTFLAAYRRAKRAGMNDDQAVKKAVEIVEAAHFTYGRGNRPQAIRATGAVGNVAYTFMTYPINNLVFLKHRCEDLLNDLHSGNKEAVKTDMKVLGSNLGYLFAFGGLIGLPFSFLAQAVLNLFDDDEEDWEVLMRKYIPGKLGQAITRGIPAALLGSDMSWRVQGTDVVGMPIGFQIAQMGKRRLEKAHKLWEQGDEIAAIFYLMPDMVRNPYRAVMGYKEGGTRTGVPPIQYSPGEAITKALSFTPTREAETWKAGEVTRKARQLRLDNLENFAEKYLIARKKKDREAVVKIKNDLKRYNDRQKKKGRAALRISWKDVMKSAKMRRKSRDKSYREHTPKYMRPYQKAVERSLSL